VGSNESAFPRRENNQKEEGEEKKDRARLTVRRSGLPAFLEVTDAAIPSARREPVRVRMVPVEVARETAPGAAFCLREMIWMPLPESVMWTVWTPCQFIAFWPRKFGHTLELANPEYLCEWRLRRLP
jgi:hypothetical protein